MSKTKTTKKAAASKATKSAKASKPAPPKKAKGVTQTGDAPRSQLDPEETKKLEATRAKKAKTPATDVEAKTKKVSAIDAAAKLLAGSKEPMGCKEMIETLAAKGIWTSPGGKTPHGTLHSAISREIATRGDESRFRKADRGKFTAAS